ncbi:hypothetical protein FHL15_011403 [Xylaria flabelliformis]|uniref:Heterokaryon incompatibility domain-containing protein n=1 Tax=Xylaria flabelliformis TaxID=2512241 RepID=A0A553HIB4_9PEZI|nr:hypothetical protein FHL15_011403 [Xylaria flabelliformis]
MMGDIYSRAATVFIWLGEEADNSNTAIDFIKVLSNCYLHGETGHERVIKMAQDLKNKKQWESLNALWNRRWWQRGWILQETVLARKADFCCGKAIVSHTDIFNHGQVLRRDWEELCSILDCQYGLRLHAPTFHTLDGMKRLVEARLGGYMMPLVICHYRTMSSKLSDPRDAIFSRLGMATDGYVASPSYTDAVSEVYSSFVMNHIHGTKSLDMILYDTRPRVTPDLLSWTPDWMAMNGAAPFEPHCIGDAPQHAQQYYSGCAGKSAQASFDLVDPSHKVLICKGYTFDVVDGVSHAEEMPPNKIHEPSPMSQPRSTECTYSCEETVFESLWKSITINQEKGGQLSPDTGSTLAECFQSAYSICHT